VDKLYSINIKPTYETNKIEGWPFIFICTNIFLSMYARNQYTLQQMFFDFSGLGSILLNSWFFTQMYAAFSDVFLVPAYHPGKLSDRIQPGVCRPPEPLFKVFGRPVYGFIRP